MILLLEQLDLFLLLCGGLSQLGCFLLHLVKLELHYYILFLHTPLLHYFILGFRKQLGLNGYQIL
jgi:hypothetical protein